MPDGVTSPASTWAAEPAPPMFRRSPDSSEHTSYLSAYAQNTCGTSTIRQHFSHRFCFGKRLVMYARFALFVALQKIRRSSGHQGNFERIRLYFDMLYRCL